MCLFLLLVLLLFLTIFSIVLCNGDMLEPAAFSVESFILVTLIGFCYNGFTNYDISIGTVFIVITALAIYMIGYFGVKCLLQAGGYIKFSKKIRTFHMPNKRLSVFLFAVEMLSFYRTFQATYSIARTINAGANLSNMLEYTRNAYLFTDASMGLLTSVLSFYTISISYFYTYALIRSCLEDRKFNFKKLLDCKLELLMVLVSLVSGMFGTGRTFLIKYIVFLFATFYYLRFFKDRVKRFSIKKMVGTLKKMIVAVVVFFALFQLMGITTNKTGRISAVDMLYEYSGSSVVAFDRSIKSYEYDGRFFGEESFYGLYGFLNSFGADIPNDILHLPFVDVGEGVRTNIYTSLRTYLYDFGFAGMYIVQFLLGVVSAVMYVLLYRMDDQPIYMLIYGILLYGTAMQGIGEITLRNFMSITNVFVILFFTMLYILTQKKIRIGTRE